MTRNLGSMDCLMRQSFASMMFWVVALGLAKGLWAIVPMSIGVAMIVTSLNGHCPFYRFLGWSTRSLARRRA